MILNKIFAGFRSSLPGKRLRYAISPPRPVELILDITGACNAACPFCSRKHMPLHRRQGYMEQELFNRIIHEAAGIGIRTLRLYSTGEPLLHPRFDEMVATALAAGLRVVVSTNAQLLDRHIQSLMKVDVLQYSIDGWDKASYERLRKGLSFERVQNNLRLFYEARSAQKTLRPQIRINCLLTADTRIEGFLETWSAWVDNIRFSPMLPPVRFNANRFESMQVEGVSESLRVHESGENGRWCSYPFHYLTIGFDGKIGLCCTDFAYSLDLGMAQEGLMKVFYSKGFKDIRKEFLKGKLETCRNCSFFYVPDPGFVEEMQSRLDVFLRKHSPAMLPETRKYKNAAITFGL